MSLEILSRSPEETQTLAARIGSRLQGGEVLAVEGDLGTGKTCFVRGLAKGLELDPDVIYSPSFTLVAEHSGRLPLVHVDLFRLADPVGFPEAEEIGLLEYLDPAGVTVIEWYEKLEEGLAGEPTLRVVLRLGSGDERHLRLEATTERGRRILEALG